jgi:uncharacterized protein YciI
LVIALKISLERRGFEEIWLGNYKRIKMEKRYFVLHLLPCRPDFAFTMTEEEKAVMQQHIAYWTEKMNQGKVVAFGPVLDPKGPYGLGIAAADSEEEIAEFIQHDPASKLNKYEYFPMRAVVPNAQRVTQ